MKYGYFDNEKKEYVITNPKTPVKWINYVGGLPFGGFIDHTGGSCLCKEDPELNRITKYMPQMPAAEFKGETMYARFKNEDGTYKIFSPYFVPTLDNYEKYECHVGMGYSKYISVFYGIQFEITVFIPMSDKILIRDIRVINKSGKDLEIDIIPVIEYSHHQALKQLTNADWVPQTMQSRVHKESDGMITLIQSAFKDRGIQSNLFSVNYPVSSYDTDRRIFLGNNEYSTWNNPLSLHNEELNNSEAYRGDNIGALMIKLGKLKNGEEKRVITQLTQSKDIKEGLPLIKKYRSEKEVDTRFNKLIQSWTDYLELFQVSTPCEDMNTLVNVHNPRQCNVTMYWSRYLSLYQLGYGARGLGYRDSCQDSMGIPLHLPDYCKTLIKKIISVQRRDGSAYHQFNPKSMIASIGDSAEKKDRLPFYSDDHLWAILATTAYIKENGDMKFLDEEVPFYDKDCEGDFIESVSVLEHLKRAIHFTESYIGKNGFPLLCFADWNDTFNLPTGAESLFTANLFGLALLEMIELCEYLGDSEQVEEYQLMYNRMKTVFNKKAWDGEWFIRYIDHKGKPIGSNKNEYGKMFINAQSWAIISGFADEEKAFKSMESMHKYLNTKNGVKLSYKAYTEYSEEKGGISTYPPGAKENGGIFLQTNPWAIIALTMLGNGDRAFEYYDQINPIKKNEKIDEFECAPYNFPQNILSDEHPHFGLARNSWLTGTASWMYQAATKNIIGILPAYDGLLINPCIPKTWNGFTVKRKYRNAWYEIEVKNPRNVSKGIKSITVDGKEIENNIIPAFGDNNTHKIEVIMG